MYLSGLDKIKPPTGSGRRERIGIYHDEGIIRVDFFFSVQELLDIEGVLGVIIGGVLVVRVLGQVVLVAQKRAHTPQLQDAFAAILADAEAGIVLVDILTRYARKVCAG